MFRAGAIVVASGKGRRMGVRRPKQFLPLMRAPLVAYCLRNLSRIASVKDIVLVIPQGYRQYVRRYIIDRFGLRRVSLAYGGPRRQDSVLAGLEELDRGCELVLIHDGVRPFVSYRQIEECLRVAGKKQSCILGITVPDTVKQLSPSSRILGTYPRHQLLLAHTPQAFRRTYLESAWRRAGNKCTFTDESQILENAGCRVHWTMSDIWNIKVTTPGDLKLAEKIVRLYGIGGLRNR